MDRRPLHTVGEAEIFEGRNTLLRLTEDTEAGGTAAALVEEDCLTAWF